MTASLRVGVVGVGYLGRFHARIYADMPEVTLVGVADSNPAVAREVAARHGCAAHTEAAALLDQVDAVSVVVPTSDHRNVSLPFLDHGVHVMLEKPVAASVREACEIVECAERAGVILQVGHVERFNAGIMALANRVHAPRFIEAHRLGPFHPRGTDVDVVTDLMIHDIDIILSLVGSTIREIRATGLPVLTEHVDIANARLEFDNGAVANVTASRVSSKRFRRMRIFGRDSCQALNFLDQQIDVVSTRKAEPGAAPEMVSERIEVEAHAPLDKELGEFVRAVRNGGRPLVGGRDGLAALEVAHRIHERIRRAL